MTLSGAWAPLGVFVVHCVASLGFDAYDRLPWFDVPMHVLGGLAIAYFIDRSLWLVLPPHASFPRRRHVEAVLIFSLVCTGAVLWELAEFLADRWAGTDSQIGLEDTLGDLLVGMLGGLAYLALRAILVLRPRGEPLG